MIIELKNVDGFTSDLEQKLIALKPIPTASSTSAASRAVVPSEAPVKEVQQGLFDIKLLNDIEDIVVRASLKKIYMGAKKASKNSGDIIPEMISELESKGKLDEKIKSLLNGILE